MEIGRPHCGWGLPKAIRRRDAAFFFLPYRSQFAKEQEAGGAPRCLPALDYATKVALDTANAREYHLYEMCPDAEHAIGQG